MPTSTLTASSARSLLERFRASGSSQTAFCKRHRVSISLFSYWLHRIQPPISAAGPDFQEVSLPSAPAPSACILTLPGGARLEFPATHLGAALTILFGGNASC